MKNQNLFIIIIIVIVVIAGFFLLTKNKGGEQSSSTSGEKPLLNLGSRMMTAKQTYPIALAEAKKWSADSYFVDLNTVNVQSGGTSKTWFIMFYSPTKSTNYKVNVIEGKVTGTSDTNKKKTDRIDDNWLDSDQAAKIAIPKCGTVIENDFFFDLKPATGNKPMQWSVNCKVGENKTLYIDLNAQTGEYLKTRKAGIGW